MASFVIDASVALKWYLPENESGVADALKKWLTESGQRMIVPLLFFDESANILWKKEVLRSELTEADTKGILWEILSLPLQIYSDRHELLPHATEIARTCQITVYDAIYVATALQNSATLITADEKLISKLAGTRFEKMTLPLTRWSELATPRS